MRTRRFLAAATAGVAALLVLAVTAGSAAAGETVKRVGATSLKYKGPEIEGVVSYRFASANLGSEWLLLDVAITGAGHDSVEVKRDNVSLRTPTDAVVSLASQAEFSEAYGELAATLARAEVASEPLDYWAGRRDERIEFFSNPGESLVFPSFWVNDRMVYAGRLYFAVPGGVRAGRYELRIKLPESELRVPFQLGER